MTCTLCLPSDVDSGFYAVKFDSLLLKEAAVEGDSILPPLRTETTESSDSDDGDAGDSSYARGKDPEPGRGYAVTLRGI